MLETALEKAESAAGQAEAGQVNASSWMYSETVKAEKSPEISHPPFSEAQNLRVVRVHQCHQSWTQEG